MALPPLTLLHLLTVTGVPSPPMPPGVNTGGERIMELKIDKSASREELSQFIEQAKAKGVELEFTNIVYKNPTHLSSLAGTIKKGKSTSTFAITDFETIIVLVLKNNDQYSCLVYLNNQKETI